MVAHMTKAKRHQILMVLAAVTLVSGAIAWASGAARPGSAAAAQSGFKIAYANSEIGNTFHQALVSAVQATEKVALKSGLVSKFTLTDANNSPTTQAAQIRQDVVAGYNAIIVDASSATALNGAIQTACSHGIIVVAVNENVTAPCAYNVSPHWPDDTKVQMEYFAQRFHGHANILNVRGVAGTLPDTQMGVTGVNDVTKQSPGLKIVGSVYGQWTQTIAEQVTSTILPSLPTVNAVVTQGGDGVGVYNAFKAAGRPIPQIVFGNRGDELRLWQSILKTDPGYDSFSISTWPGGISSFGIWATVALLKKVVDIKPSYIYFPLSEITTGTLAAWIKVTPPSGVATRSFTYAAAVAVLKKEPNIPIVATAGPTGPISGL